MTLLDVKYAKFIKLLSWKPEALKDIHSTVEKGDHVAIMGESDLVNQPLPNILAMLTSQRVVRSS